MTMDNSTKKSSSYKTKKSLTFTTWLLILVGIVGSFVIWVFAKPVIVNTDVTPTGFAVQGVAINQTSGYVDFQNLANNGIDFAYLRATSGNSFADDGYKSSYTRAKSAKLKVGAIQVYSSNTTAAVQAQYFIDNVGNQIGELPIAIQVPDDQISTATDAQRLASLIQTLYSHYTHDIVIYTTPAVQKQLSDTIKDTKYWLIEDNTDNKAAENQFIQYDEDRTIGSGLKAVKMPTSVFNGTKKQFEAYK